MTMRPRNTVVQAWCRVRGDRVRGDRGFRPRAVGWLIRWGTDGAYISFTYARSLVRGDGLTWSGDHIEALMTPSATGFFVTDSNRFYFAQQCGSYVIASKPQSSPIKAQIREQLTACIRVVCRR